MTVHIDHSHSGQALVLISLVNKPISISLWKRILLEPASCSNSTGEITFLSRVHSVSGIGHLDFGNNLTGSDAPGHTANYISVTD